MDNKPDFEFLKRTNCGSKIWKPDYTAFIRPELAEVIYDHARNSNTSYEQFKKVWTPRDWDSIKGMVLVLTEYSHNKYGKILVDKLLLLPEEYSQFHSMNPLFEFFDGEVELTFKQLIKKTITDPYIIFLYTEGSPSSFIDSGTLLSNSFQTFLQGNLK